MKVAEATETYRRIAIYDKMQYILWLCYFVGLSRNINVHHNTPPLVSNLIQINPYPTAFPYGNGMVLHFYQQQESSTTKTVHKVINKRLKTYV